jgi:hypothetical protein
MIPVRHFSSGEGRPEGGQPADSEVAGKAKEMQQDSDKATGEASASTGEGQGEAAEEAPPEPLVLFRAPSLGPDFDDATRLVNYSALGSAFGLGAALLGIAPFTAPNTFVVALMLAVVQVRLAHTWQMRVMRAQVRRHVEEVVQLPEGRISIRSGNLKRTLQLSAATAAGEKPQLSEVLRHGHPFVFIDRKLGKVQAQEALDAIFESDRAITSEDLDITVFEEETKDEADKVVQPLSKISSKELETISKKAVGMDTPKAAMAQASKSAITVAGVIVVAGGVLGISGRRQANVLPPGSVQIE